MYLFNWFVFLFFVYNITISFFLAVPIVVSMMFEVYWILKTWVHYFLVQNKKTYKWNKWFWKNEIIKKAWDFGEKKLK